MTTLLQRVSAYTRLQLRWTCSLMAANAVSQLWNTLCLLMASHITTNTAYFFACRLPIFICILSSLFLLHHSSIYLVVIPAITSSHRTTTVHSSTTISWSDAFAHTYLILSSLFFFYHFFSCIQTKIQGVEASVSDCKDGRAVTVGIRPSTTRAHVISLGTTFPSCLSVVKRDINIYLPHKKREGKEGFSSIQQCPRPLLLVSLSA